MKNTDIVVIGSGAGGLTAAYTAKGFGKSVIIIDKNKPGGECTWSGCIPSKALINQANDIFTAKKYAEFTVDTKDVMTKVRNVIEGVYEDESIELLRKDGFDFIEGRAEFIDSKTIKVGAETVSAKKIIICTGSSPMVPPISGLDKVDFLTNESIFELESLPESMIVLGGGAIGIELSQAMTRLGVKIDVVEMADEILPREDRELTTLLRDNLEKEGLSIHTSSKAVSVKQENGKVELEIEVNGGLQVVKADQILLALGRVPNTGGLNLEAAEIKFDRKGIKINEYLETSVKNIYAIGDVAGPYLFSHMANAQGIQAIQNAVLPVNRKMKYDHVAWCTFTSPELATAGLTEADARKKYGDSIRVYRHDYDHLDRAKTKANSIGCVKLICDKKGKVLGCSILGERAGELISEVQVVKTTGMNYAKLGGVIHPYPTYSEIHNKIGKKVQIDNLLNLPIVRLFTKK